MNFLGLVLTLTLPILCLVAFVTVTPVVCSQDRSRTLELIREQDALAQLSTDAIQSNALSGFSATFTETRQPILGFSTGVTICNSEVAWSREWCVLRVTCSLEHDPIFKPLGTPGYQGADYDSSGNLIVRCLVEKYALYSRETNEAVDVWATYMVDEMGKVTTNGTFQSTNHFPIGDRNSVYLFWQFIQATGRGLADNLTAVTSEQLSGAGVEVEAKGRFGNGLAGHWKLTCEKGSDPIVRTAKFFSNMSLETPAVEISNSGNAECQGLRIAEFADLRIGPLETKFQVLSLSPLKSSDPELNTLYRDVLRRIKGLPRSNAQVIEWRGEKPMAVPAE